MSFVVARDEQVATDRPPFTDKDLQTHRVVSSANQVPTYVCFDQDLLKIVFYLDLL